MREPGMKGALTRKKRKKSSDDGLSSINSWMITFSDLCTLLLTFFVLLLSMSSFNDRTFKMIFQKFDASSGVLRHLAAEKVTVPPKMVVEELLKTLRTVRAMDIRDIDEVTEDELISDENLHFYVLSGNTLWIKKDEDTLSFIFGDQALFESAEAELKPTAYPVLDKIGEFLEASNYLVLVDGHTDSLPIRTERFPSNVELSVARAYSVLSYLVEKGNVPASRLAMGGYGSSHPLADNATPEGRAMNRRVEVIMKRPL